MTIQSVSEIFVGRASEGLKELLPDSRVIVITDATIEHLYHDLVGRFESIIIGHGEANKSLDTALFIYNRLMAMGADRSTFLLGVGGGIITDITGFVASTFMRGVRFGFVSTTLLGQVDASVGGKNGVNLDGYKNMIGCFNQPEFVLCDIEMLHSLSDRQFRAGLAELIKTGMLGNRVLFEMVEAMSFEELRRDPLLMADLILMAVKIKAGIVERDERESGERRKLNLGHTVAHAIEKSSRKMLHGEAVAVGCVVMARLSVNMGFMPEREAARIEAVFARLGFTLTSPAPIEKMIVALRKDKKAAADQIRIVLPVAIGRCEVRSVAFDWLEERLREVMK